MRWWPTCRWRTSFSISSTSPDPEVMDDRCCFSSLHQGELHVSRLFHHPSILPYKSVFIAENELWVVSPLMAYGEEPLPAPPRPLSSTNTPFFHILMNLLVVLSLPFNLLLPSYL